MDKRKFDVITLLERPRALFCGPSRVRSHLLRGTEFVVLLNFDNVLETPRSARRNHYRTNWTFAGNEMPIAFLYRAQNLPSLLFYLNRNGWSWQYAGRVSCELRNRPRSPWSLCSSVEEHRSAESDGLRLDSSWGLRIFLCPTLVTRRITSFSNIWIVS